MSARFAGGKQFNGKLGCFDNKGWTEPRQFGERYFPREESVRKLRAPETTFQKFRRDGVGLAT